MTSKKLSIAVITILILTLGFFALIKKTNIFKSAETKPDVWNELNANPTSEGDLAPNKLYENYDIGFGFLYPKNFEINEIDEDVGFTVLAQNPGKREGFQIFIIPFDEPDSITSERVKKDLPDEKIENPQTALIGPDKKIEALIFFSEKEGIGKTREVWFVQNGYLFQVTTYADLDNFIASVMGTWRTLKE